MLEIKKVSYQAQSLKWLVRNISLAVPAGQFLCIVGPNGAGKSTLLRMISNELVPTEGFIRLKHRNLRDYDPTELAKVRAYLAQKRDMAFPFRALQIVLLGRHPYLQGRKESSHDVLFAQQQLQAVRERLDNSREERRPRRGCPNAGQRHTPQAPAAHPLGSPRPVQQATRVTAARRRRRAGTRSTRS